MDIRSIAQRTAEIVEEITSWPKLLQIKFLKDWLTAIGPDGTFLEAAVREAQTAYATGAYTQDNDGPVEDFMEAKLEEGRSLTAKDLADQCLSIFNIPISMKPHLINVGVRVKNRVYNRKKKQMQRKNGKTRRAGDQMVVLSAPPPVDRREQPKAGPESRYDLNEAHELISQLKKYVQPGIYQCFVTAVEFLWENARDCPSVMTDLTRSDVEASDFKQVPELLELLTNVSLWDHVLLSMKYVIDIVTEDSKLGESWIVPAIAAALLFDAGKTPELIGLGLLKKDKKYNHVYGGADKFKGIFMDVKPPWFRWVADAIENHHDEPTPDDENRQSDTLTEILRQADIKARTEEVVERSKYRFTAVKIEKWLNIDDLVSELKPKINDIFYHWHCLFSYYRTVYCSPDVLFEAARSIATRNNCFDIRMVRRSERKFVLVKLTDLLRDAGYIHGEIKAQNYGRDFLVKFRDPKRDDCKRRLLPLRLEIFGLNMSDAEAARKSSPKTRTIKDVTSYGHAPA